MITRKRKKNSDTDGQDKGGGKKTRTNVVGARCSLNMATTNTNNTAMAPTRDGAKPLASMTTMKMTNNTTAATKTVLSRVGAKQAANPATTKTNNTTASETVPKGQPNEGRKAVARRKMNQSRKSNNSNKQVIKSVHVNEDEEDYNDVEGNNDGDDDGDQNGDDDDGDDDDGSGSGNSSGSGKGEGSTFVSEYYDVVERVDEDDDECDDNDDDGNGRRDDGKSDKVGDDYGDSDDDAGTRGNRPTSKSAVVLNMDGGTKVRGMSSMESSQVVQKHVAF